ncbi:MAG: efflux RND transporter periplasmic adaptor subunit [Xanthobacteraceae bacterium]
MRGGFVAWALAATVLLALSALLPVRAAADDRTLCDGNDTPPDARIAACTAMIARGVERVEVRSRVAGYVQAVHVREGASVRAGDLLVTVDQRLFRAQVQQAEAQVSAAQARMSLAKQELDRGQQRGTSLADLDTRRNAQREAEANLRTAQAVRQSALTNLLDTEIRAPVTGRVGKLEVDPGSLVQSGDPPLATIELGTPITASLLNRGNAWSAKGDLDRAVADYNEAIRLDEKNAAALTALDQARRVLAARPAPATSLQTGARPVKETRIALVIGNSSYKAVATLPNPRRDAAAFAAALRAVGFQTVTVASDLTREKFVDALRSFAAEAEKADWAVVYFAGHGIEIGGVNYLVPVDAKLVSDRDAQYDAVSLEQVVGAVEAAKKMRLVIIDACRENPFAQQMKRTVASRSISRGLGRIEPEGGTLVAYSAKHGEIALDGDGTNSPFVTALIRHLPTPGVEINKFFRLVRDEVLTATARKQEPFVYGSLPSEDFFFVQ